ncbi:MAG: CHASE sensor domain-containing protein, partial [Acidobacteriota bacterium]
MNNALEAWFHRLSLVRKLTAIGVVSATASLAMGGAVLVAYDLTAEYHDEVREVSIIANVAGINSAAALTFDDARAASEILSALRSNAHVIAAAIQLPDGRVLARFDRDPWRAQVPPPAPAASGPQHYTDLRAGTMTVIVPIVFNDERIGFVFVNSDLAEIRARVGQYLVVLGVVLAAGMALSLVLSNRLQAIISSPLLRLTEVTRRVTRDHLYDARVEKADDDEIGELIDRFNDMLIEIQRRDQQLLLQQNELEQTVDARTVELRSTNEDLIAARDKAMEASRAKSEFL